MPTTQSVQNITQEMESKRLELKYFALYHGYSHPATVKISQELDELFNLYHQMTQK
ncbi:aspartyl-phosphate phosphatase Spo0E family protein [Rossellomorea aquimaris]|uniref:aspartyl-phosphate phosphatase Spo0E family protein n=1 Tax=Rossellomorea aquimaris TaxID=189382 RepID=UPI001CD28335|nr:aspartyl-phosphate phosphatase Spo0E family protein [Rossellomorea aquimaris]MCA1060789.1 aspartyl-phosphate phosphatase Spo0E family protein [Rossellomorea aquimaris]